MLSYLRLFLHKKAIYNKFKLIFKENAKIKFSKNCLNELILKKNSKINAKLASK